MPSLSSQWSLNFTKEQWEKKMFLSLDRPRTSLPVGNPKRLGFYISFKSDLAYCVAAQQNWLVQRTKALQLYSKVILHTYGIAFHAVVVLELGF